MRTYDELVAAIIANYTAVVKELGDDVVAAGLDDTDALSPSPDHFRVVTDRCGLAPQSGQCFTL
jgi:hypothetical protein